MVSKAGTFLPVNMRVNKSKLYVNLFAGLKLVRARAVAIELASDMEKGGMAVVHYNAGSRLKEAIVKAKEWCSDRGINDPECVVATYLNTNTKIIAGHAEVRYAYKY